MILDVVVPGQPVGKGRPRVVRTPKGVRTFTPEATVSWESTAAWYFKQGHRGAPPTDKPCVLLVQAVASRPKYLMRKKDPPGRIWRCAKPDGDNVIKCVGDALKNAGVVRDDLLIVDWRVLCLYAAKDEGPSVEVRLYAATDVPMMWWPA